MERIPDDTPDSAKWYGRAEILPDAPVDAGQMGTWTIRYRVGRYGVDNGGRIRVAMRLASDWAIPQVEDPSAPHYLTVTTDGEARLEAAFEPKAHYRPWFRVTTIYVLDGSLEEGDRVDITFGDRSGGGPGTRAQSFRETSFEFRVLVESFETDVFVRVPTSPTIEIRGGKPSRLVVVGPGQVVEDEEFSVTVKVEDSWGNPSDGYDGRVHLFTDHTVEGMPGSIEMSPGERGVHRVSGLRAVAPGQFRISATEEALGFFARSNPIECLERAPQHRLYWADLHGQTNSTVGTGSVEEYFAFARDVGCVDACTHQGNDFQIGEADWAEIIEGTEAFHEPGRFVTFPGYEWSGNTPAGGDHNVLYLETGLPLHRSSHWQVWDTSDEHLDRYPITELYDTLRGEEALIIPHIGGRRANPDLHDPGLEPVIEITSVHGRFEWFLHEALERGYKVGVIGAGDDHTGRPGASYGTSASFGVRGGLAGIFATSLTREGIWEALKSRRTYATTGERILLSVTCEGHPMGSEFATSREPTLFVRVKGTAPLYSVEVVKNTRTAYSHRAIRSGARLPHRLRIAWSGARIKSRGRHLVWDGSLRMDGGEFLSAEEFAFDNPRHGITSVEPGEIRWTSITCGDLDGILVEFEGNEESVFRFESDPIDFSFTPADLALAPVELDAGGIEGRVSVELDTAERGPDNVEFTFCDEDADYGEHSYYVRVLQEDGEMAWSSPIYVDYRCPTR